MLGRPRPPQSRRTPLPSSYPKADEAERNIIGAMLQRELGEAVLEALVTKDSKSVAGIQVSDLLLGATMAAFQKLIQADHKHAVVQEIAEHLGWPDLCADTYPSERKFNIWYFQNTRDARELVTRPVRLRYPLPQRAFPNKIAPNRGGAPAAPVGREAGHAATSVRPPAGDLGYPAGSTRANPTAGPPFVRSRGHGR